ncbi:hypothetical protein BDV10DRAFT_177231 [Aspergillus recurvatus]
MINTKRDLEGDLHPHPAPTTAPRQTTLPLNPPSPHPQTATAEPGSNMHLVFSTTEA